MMELPEQVFVVRGCEVIRCNPKQAHYASVCQIELSEADAAERAERNLREWINGRRKDLAELEAKKVVVRDYDSDVDFFGEDDDGPF